MKTPQNMFLMAPDCCHLVAPARLVLAGDIRKRYASACAAYRTRATAARWLCLGTGLLGMEWSLFPLGVWHVDSRTPKSALGCGPLGPERKSVALRARSLGAVEQSRVTIRRDPERRSDVLLRSSRWRRCDCARSTEVRAAEISRWSRLSS